MSEQERPRTEAPDERFRYALRTTVAGVLPNLARSLENAFDEALEAARTEGRQQAVRLLDAVSGYFDTVDQERSPAEVYQKETALRRAWESALHQHRVAGLNASESPPSDDEKPLPCGHCGYAGTDETGYPIFVGDASESGRRGDNVVTGSAALTSNAGDTAGWADVRDAMTRYPPPSTEEGRRILSLYAPNDPWTDITLTGALLRDIIVRIEEAVSGRAVQDDGLLPEDVRAGLFREHVRQALVQTITDIPDPAERYSERFAATFAKYLWDDRALRRLL